MQFQFDATQDYQLRAIASVAEVFRGLRPDRAAGRFATVLGARVELGDEAQFKLDSAQLLANIQAVQRHNGLEASAELRLVTEPNVDVGGAKQTVAFPNVSVEMETGTGKTYVYLRTALELHRQHGLRRFVVVVPSVAVREGVVKTFEVTRGHFAKLYDNVPYRWDVYDGKNLTKVRGFAEDDGVRFLVMTVDSFNKEQNVIRQRRDRNSPAPLHLLQSARPVLILDEPQNLESAKSKAALAALNPLVALRYSATHRDSYNLVYRLGPFEAYRQNLVKRIEVAPVVTADDFNSAFVNVVEIATSKKAVVAKIAVQQRMADGRIKEKAYTFRPGECLQARTERSEYASFVVDTIDAAGTVSFTNGVVVAVGRPHGADAQAVFREQVRYTVEQHFRRQEQLRAHGIKVLSLFFLDRVANYTGAGESEGLVRRLFDEAFEELKANYPAWQKYRPDQVRAAYFASKKRKGGGVEFQDSAGENAEDRAAYALIMRDKEKLLSFAEPTAFVFSHSALKEGWDNPNVFQICTLNQTASEVKKRQEVGRGLRLAVDQTGARRRDEGVNVLTVVANESYESFVLGLQNEIAAEFGAAEAGKLRVTNARTKTKAVRKSLEDLPPEFRQLWAAISPKTRYRVRIDTPTLVAHVVDDLNLLSVSPPRVVVTRARLDLKEDGRGGFAFVAMQMAGAKTLAQLDGKFPLPDLVGKVAEQLAHVNPPMRLTRKTILEIVAGVKPELRRAALENPEGFASAAAGVIRAKLDEQLVDGIRYEPDGEFYGQELFAPSVETSGATAPATKSLYDKLAVDSEVERKFAERLEKSDRVKFYLKLPGWFKVATPLGTYNPDWALVWQDADEFGAPEDRLVLVRETKGSLDPADLRPDEARKIACGNRHYETLGVDYQVMTAADALPGGPSTAVRPTWVPRPYATQAIHSTDRR